MEKPIDAIPMYTSRMVWDMMPCGEAMDTLRALGITPPSDETAEMEHEQSHRRLDATARYTTRIALMAQIAAKIALRWYVMEPDEYEGLTEDQIVALEFSYAALIASAATAIIANLMADDKAGVTQVSPDQAASFGFDLGGGNE
jgi:hypothetical protein